MNLQVKAAKFIVVYSEKEAAATYQYANTSLMDGLSKWGTKNERAIYTIHKRLLVEVQKKIRNGNKLPLLSTPTHTTHWIAPITLVKRMLQYHKAGEALQLAHQSFDERG